MVREVTKKWMKKVRSAVLDLEDILRKAEELHAITLLYYDSFVESEAFANTSEFYKTAVSIIESNVEEVQRALGEAFKELLTLVREEKSKTKEE
jgi:hypothetical protein|nr:MAG TPA: hypothetical protein [Caudoviricetes sp.]